MEEEPAHPIEPRPTATFRLGRFLVMPGLAAVGFTGFAFLLAQIGAPDVYSGSRTAGLWHLVEFPALFAGDLVGFDATCDSLPSPFSGLAALLVVGAVNFALGMVVGLGAYAFYAHMPPPPSDD